MKLTIFSKSQNSEGNLYVENLKSLLKKQKIDFFAFDTKDFENLQSDHSELKKEIANSASMIVFGGDGTTLKAVALCEGLKVPILPVNLGDKGFLAELERTATPETILEAVKTYGIEKRDLIEVSYLDKKIVALNDVVLKSHGTTPIYLKAKVSGETLDTYRADGVIVSTPTGSTAYSLSAGGPILAPNVDGLVINPICAHTLYSRPIVVSFDSVIELKLSKENEIADVVVDGRLIDNVTNLEKIIIQKANKSALFLRNDSTHFYKKLLQKMNIWGKFEN